MTTVRREPLDSPILEASECRSSCSHADCSRRRRPDARGRHPFRHGPGTRRPPDAGTVLRVPDRLRQQAGAVGPHRRIHAPGGCVERSDPDARAGQVHQRQSVRRARDQRARHAEEPGSLQAAAAEALLPGRRADRRGARRDLRAGQARHRGHVQHPRDRDRRVADGRRAGPPAGDRQLAAGEEDSRQRDLPARAEPEPGWPDHDHRLVQQEPRHAVRNQPDPLPLSPVRRARQQP